MSSIIVKRIKGRLYLYKSTSYRDEGGKPRTNRVYVGKVNPETGAHEYKQEYLDRLDPNERTGIEADIKSYSENDIKQSVVLEYGASYFYRQIAEKTGLYRILQETMPDCWQDIFTAACYLVSNDEPIMYCDDWVGKTDGLPSSHVSASTMCRLLKDGITNQNRNDFYMKWAAYRQEQEYLALDITSFSSYSKLISEVEWGHNRDEENLPQINLCLLLGEKTRIPVYPSVYSGSLGDVTTLQTTIKLATSLSIKKMMLVMDKGFYSQRNIDFMLKDESIKFMIAATFTSAFVREQVEAVRQEIYQAQNAIVLGDDIIFGVTREVKWKDRTIYAHVYYNAVGATIARSNLYGEAASLAEHARSDPSNEKLAAKYKKYLLIKKAESEGGHDNLIVSIRQDVLDKQVAMSGWLVIFSNHVTDASDAIHIYRAKDVVEKGFNKFKNSLEMERLRVHNSDSMENKIFAAFIGLIIMSYIHNVMVERGLYYHLTFKRLIHTLEKLRVQYINGNRILFPVTKEQSDIFQVFDIEIPV